VWLATSSHVEQYLALARSDPEGVFACRDFHASKVAMGGHPTCYTGPSKA
jgi:hypothetical protein